MTLYLLVSVCSALLCLVFRRTFSFLILLASLSFVIFLLPSTGQDYNFYKNDYLSASYTNSFPFFTTSTVLTAEPFYKWYSAVISVVTGLPFEGFLVVNFIFCYSLLFLIFRSFFRLYPSLLFLVVGLVSIVPTIFYFSPRSSISFVISIAAFFYFVREKNMKGLALSFVTIGFHSQFIPALFFVFLGSVFYKNLTSRVRVIGFYVFMGLLLLLILKFPGEVYERFSSVIMFLPTANFIGQKLSYFNEQAFVLRVTGFLSVFVFPAIFVLMVSKGGFFKLVDTRRNVDVKRLEFLLGVLVYFGFMVNLLMFGNAHVAGRLSRMSDYLLMLVLIPGFLYLFDSQYRSALIVCCFLFLFFLAPFLYPTLYNFNISIP